MSHAQENNPSLRTSLRWPMLVGTLAACALLAVGVGWAGLTRISGAVIAPGAVEVAGKPKSVQHLDGGIVESILVSDGQSVGRGDVLVRLDATLLQANLDIYKTRLSEANAMRARLAAEQSGAQEITFAAPDPLVEGAQTALHRTGQTKIFEARRELERGRQAQLAEKIRQFRNQITGVDALIEAKQRQGALLEEELASVIQLSEKGLVRASQLLGLQRQQADLLGQIAEHRSELARIENSIRDTEIEILQGQRQLKEEVVTQLRDVTTQIHELRQQTISTVKQLERINIRAPVSGRVHEMQFTTIGGVVPAGATILQIVARDEGLSFSTRIDPAAVDQVYVGQEARLRFSAFNQRTTPELTGHVADISPTSVEDEATGMSFFRVRLNVPQEQLARLGTLKLVPGMPVEAYLKTTDRTVLSYLIKPLSDQIAQAFREE